MTRTDKPGLAEDVEPVVDAHYGIEDAAGPAHKLVLCLESRPAGIGHILDAGKGRHHLVLIGMYSPAGPDLNNPVGIGLIVLAGTGQCMAICGCSLLQIVRWKAGQENIMTAFMVHYRQFKTCGWKWL